jgi:hypothetical protein
MLRPFLLASAVGVGLAGLAPAVLAQQPSNPNCQHWRAIAAHLDAKFAERPVAAGLQTNGNLLQLFVSTETGTWSMVVVQPSGMGCLVSAGKGWESVPEGPDGPAA